LLKLNDFRTKKTDFKNTLYKSNIHIDKPYIPQNLNKSKKNRTKIIIRKDSINYSNNNTRNFQEREKLIERSFENNKVGNITKRNYSSSKLTLEDKTICDNAERISLNTIKNKQRRELRLTNLISVQLANVNMTNTFSNNPILGISEHNITKVDRKSDTDINNRIKNFENKRRKFDFNKNKEKENEKNISFNNFQPLNYNKEKISNMEKAKKIMYDKKMSKLIDYFRQGGI
jgi:hypothetical protein